MDISLAAAEAAARAVDAGETAPSSHGANLPNTAGGLLVAPPVTATHGRGERPATGRAREPAERGWLCRNRLLAHTLGRGKPADNGPCPWQLA